MKNDIPGFPPTPNLSLSNVQQGSGSQGLSLVMHYKNEKGETRSATGNHVDNNHFSWRDSHGITWSAPKEFLHTDPNDLKNAPCLPNNRMLPVSLPKMEMPFRAYYNPGNGRKPVEIEGMSADGRFIAPISGVLRAIPERYFSLTREQASYLPVYNTTVSTSLSSSAMLVHSMVTRREENKGKSTAAPGASRAGEIFCIPDLATFVVSHLKARDAARFFLSFRYISEKGVLHKDVPYMVKAMKLKEQGDFFRQSLHFPPRITEKMTDTRLPPSQRIVAKSDDYRDSAREAKNAAWLARRAPPLAVSGKPLDPVVWNNPISWSEQGNYGEPFVEGALKVLKGETAPASAFYLVNPETETGNGTFFANHDEEELAYSVAYTVSREKHDNTLTCRFSVSIQGWRAAEFSMSANCNSVYDFSRGAYVKHALDWLDKAIPAALPGDRSMVREVLEGLSEAFLLADSSGFLHQHIDRMTNHVKTYFERSTTLDSAPMIRYLISGIGNFEWVSELVAEKDKTDEAKNSLAQEYAWALQSGDVDELAVQTAMFLQLQDMIGRGLSQESLASIALDLSDAFARQNSIPFDQNNYVPAWESLCTAIGALLRLSSVEEGRKLLLNLGPSIDLATFTNYEEQRRSCVRHVDCLLAREILKAIANPRIADEERNEKLNDLNWMVLFNQLDREGVSEHVLSELSRLLPQEREKPGERRGRKLLDICENLIGQELTLSSEARADLMARFSGEINANAPDWFNNWVLSQLEGLSNGPMSEKAGVALGNLATSFLNGNFPGRDAQSRTLDLMERLAVHPMSKSDRDKVLGRLRMITEGEATHLASSEFSGRLDALAKRIESGA